MNAKPLQNASANNEASKANEFNLADSPMQLVHVDEQPIFIKRDDLLHPYFSGNKARKFAYYLEQPFETIETLVGYGSAQANSLYSLAALAQLRGWKFDYYCYALPQWLKENPAGNYKGALEQGANIIEVSAQQISSNLDDYMLQLSKGLPQSSLFIAEGGRCEQAEYGVKKLADEINDYCQENQLKNPLVMLPAGTGTTALFLKKHTQHQVVTCACVGDITYLRKQFKQLCSDEKQWPEILATSKKFHFGKLDKALITTWLDIKKQTDITFDLLYDPIGWQTLQQWLAQKKHIGDVIYVHQGGVIGNQSMLARYKRKFPALFPA